MFVEIKQVQYNFIFAFTNSNTYLKYDILITEIHKFLKLNYCEKMCNLFTFQKCCCG